MGLSFKIGNTTFGPLVMAAGTYAKAFSPGSAKTDLQRYHLRNCPGNLLGIGAVCQTPIICECRYVGVLADVMGDYQQDISNWENPHASGIMITAYDRVYDHCRLKDEGARITAQPKATGRGEGLVYMDVEYSFICDDSTEPSIA